MKVKKEDKKIIYVFAAIALIVFGIVIIGYLNNSKQNPKYTETPTNIPDQESQNGNSEVVLKPGADPLNASYLIENKVVTLVNGKFEEQIPDSSIVIKSYNWNTPVEGSLTDFTGEKKDASFILVQEPGGSGLFYYVVASLAANEGYIGTNGILLGDRIAPQNMEIRQNKVIVVNYADRVEGASMTDKPSVGVSKYFKIQGVVLVEIPAPTNQTSN
jgi:hypothetical protein